MAGRLADRSSSTAVTLTADGACYQWVTNTAAVPITVNPSPGTTFHPGVSSYSLPAGKTARFKYLPNAGYWLISV